MKTTYKRFLEDKLVRKQKPDFGQIAQQLQRSLKDLRTAQSILEIDLTWSFTVAYHSMTRAGRALMYSKGYLPTGKRSHKTIVEFTRSALGSGYDSLVGRFDRMRRQRHNFIYDSENHMTYREAKSALEAAERLIDKIVALVRQENPERDLFD